MFWQKEIETLSRDKLSALQLERLGRTLARVYERVPFYRKAMDGNGFRPEDLRGLKDITALPFTTREDLRAGYPDGLLAVERTEAVRLHTSSGTTGKPKAIFFSRRDLDQAAELLARCLVMTGTGPGDVLQNMMTYGLFTGALMMHYAAEKVGILVIPSGPGNTERQLDLMRDFGTTVLHITPSYLLYLADYLARAGLDPARDLKLKRAYVGAEPYNEETRRKIESLYGIDIYNSYGLSEMNGPGVAFECAGKQGMHLWEDNFLMEVVDPETGRPRAEGEAGELILTTLNREAMPIIRYRTRDITSVISEPCACGRTHRRITRIAGRADDMFIVRGVNIFPQQVERVLMAVSGVAQNYQIILDSYDQMTVRVEIQREVFDGHVEHLIRLKNLIIDRLRSEIVVRPEVELVEPGSLPTFEGKGKRVIDRRTM